MSRESLTSRALAAPVRVTQFLAVGALGALVDNAVLVAAHELLGAPVLAGKVLGAEASILVMFAANERWTFGSFGDTGWRSVARRLVRSNLVRVGGLATGVAVLAALHYGFGVWYVAANVAGLCAGVVVNYCLETLYTWRAHRS